MKKIPVIIFSVLGSLVLASCSSGKSKDRVAEEQTVNVDSNKATAPVAGLPAFQMVNEDGNVFKLSDLKGKKVFVNLWASWCPPCRAELPSIQKLYQSLDTSKTVFLLLSLDDNFDKAKQFRRNSKLKLPVYYPAEQLPELFNVDGIPATFIFNEQGELIKRVDGREDYNTDQYRNLLNS